MRPTSRADELYDAHDLYREKERDRQKYRKNRKRKFQVKGRKHHAHMTKWRKRGNR